MQQNKMKFSMQKKLTKIFIKEIKILIHKLKWLSKKWKILLLEIKMKKYNKICKFLKNLKMMNNMKLTMAIVVPIIQIYILKIKIQK